MAEMVLASPRNAARQWAVADASSSGGAQRIERLQTLRAIAACMVVLFHAISNYMPAGSVFLRFDLYQQLAGGVDIFFFISGFLIRTTTYRSFGRENLVDYLKKRFARVVPYYWLITACVVVLALVAPGAFRSYQFEWRNALAAFLFIPWPRIDGTIFPPLVQGWSLNFEILFYLAFAVLMICVRRDRAVHWLAGIFALAILGGSLAGANPELFIAGNPFVLEFVAGAVFADVWRARQGSLPTALGWTCLGLAAVLIPTLCTGRWPGVTAVQILGFSSLSIAFMTLPAPRVPAWLQACLAYLGEASYSIYLIHPIVLSPMAQILYKSGLVGGQSILIVIIMSILAVAVSVLAYRVIEVPLLAWTRRRMGLRG